jgi:TPP-dependent 2-oxoacid decarboxylase
LTETTALVVETGDAWFLGQFLKLPQGATYHWQMQYGSTGWAVPAALGVALGSESPRKVIALVGDGAFQMTFQAISSIIRQRVHMLIVLINNRRYATCPPFKVRNWDYAALVDKINCGEGHGVGIAVRTDAEFVAALSRSEAHDGLTLVDCQVEEDACSAANLKFRSMVGVATMRP